MYDVCTQAHTHTTTRGAVHSVCEYTVWLRECDWMDQVWWWWEVVGWGVTVCGVCVCAERERERGVCVGPPLADSGSGGGGIVQL